MNVLNLSQAQFAITTVYHFFFVPLTLGLSVLVAIMETLYVRKGNVMYKQMAQYWGKLFLINFAMGVVTGLVMEFQFGMNWSEYARFVGDIFGAPLAIESLTAFFLESTFLGLWVFGWDKLSPKVHCATIWLAAFGAAFSALWILVANSFMQAPTGYVMENGHPVLDDFGKVISNPHVWTQFPHTLLSGFTTGGFFVMGISIFYILKKSHVEFFKESFKIANIFGTIAVLAVIAVGHQQAQLMVRQQPMKMAAAEQLWDSEDPAALAIFSTSNLEEHRNEVDIRMPGMLSFLAYNKFSGEVEGMNDLQAQYEAKYGPGNYIPDVYLSYWTFHLMVGSGILMLLLGAIGWWLWDKKKLDISNKWWYILFLALFLPYIANTTGWLLTEMGRQPWVVYGLLKTQNAFSPNLTTGMVLTSLIVFTVVYGALMVADIYLLVKFAKVNPQPETQPELV